MTPCHVTDDLKPASLPSTSFLNAPHRKQIATLRLAAGGTVQSWSCHGVPWTHHPGSIVTEKLLTGFDAPILYCMYLDKPMRDHVLLQAIARVNRPYEDDEGRRKTCGFVLDFVGIFDKLEKALAFDSLDVEDVEL